MMSNNYSTIFPFTNVKTNELMPSSIRNMSGRNITQLNELKLSNCSKMSDNFKSNGEKEVEEEEEEEEKEDKIKINKNDDDDENYEDDDDDNKEEDDDEKSDERNNKKENGYHEDEENVAKECVIDEDYDT